MTLAIVRTPLDACPKPKPSTAMHDTLFIKLATYSDAIRIARMSAALIEYGLPPAWSTARVAHHIRRKNSVVLVAKAAENLLGFAVMDFDDQSAHLNLLGVSTLARRRGVGRLMLEWLHESAITAGTFSIDLELRAENLTALKFYTSMGYRQCAYVPKYYCGQEDAIRMTRNLAVTIPAARDFEWLHSYRQHKI
jgi:ribosomal-protein-alanine N-acetyltransferase